LNIIQSSNNHDLINIRTPASENEVNLRA